MGWNLEVAAVKTDELFMAVPDVFLETETTMGFEDATSFSRFPNLCVAQVGDWAVTIETGHRLSGSTDYLEERSAGTELHLVRIDDQAIALHFVNGQPVAEERKPDGEDGETWAMGVLFDRTGVSFGGLWDVKFTLFEV
ncbi:hypothetical protein ACQP2T_55970 [Nonomuraea sp. CA-143628]|uniref:hypothetical protein n=1 Tax=Nonomuraea sp. CA-143628 TaxID=3239997 RepID=UPI003D8BA48B